ncbi:zinc-dependent alcohol dehydrogenase family protein [Pikeienuella piscinae]|uniref:enoyl-[acyl-carrier-protein] reductase n=1 Tax=Pikeienuella piscinae TaxID=2748098 RepID=A0A7L5BUA7_9RHOB|nr:zinc-dependent alcohol dehydrogenase family protein [Pikeienuella piscinae]QIE55355.1 zinc-dependent alcohol dehydrogenase family protein [Pikeienuella piscinae]
MKQVQLIANGAPHEVCKVVDVPDPGAPRPGRAVVRMMACGINPADLLGFEGRYPGPSPLPAPCGIEGAGVIEAVGEGGDLAVGDHVIVLARANWAEKVEVDAAALARIPKTLSWRDAAQLKVNPPTAYLMLRDYVKLKPGDWVAQNAANSAVGLHLIRFAREIGAHTANFVRREELVAPLKAHGADIVLVGGEDQAARLRTEIGDAAATLGIDAIGGPATRWMADCLTDGATTVNYGYLSGAPCEIEPSHLIVRGQTLTGFWLGRGLGRLSAPEREALFADMAAAFEAGRIVSPVEAEYGLDQLADALRHAAAGGRGGKILLTPNGALR